MEILQLNTNPGILVPDLNPLVAASVARQHEGADSHLSVMVGNVRGDKSLLKTIPVGIMHGKKEPIYNMTLTRAETLEPWLTSCDVNFLGTPLPMPYPAGIQKFGVPAIPALPDLALPTIGLPSIPFPSFSFPLPDVLGFFLALVELFASIAGTALVAIKMAISAILQDLIEKVKLALPELSLSVPIEWLMGLLFQINPLSLLGLLPSMISVPAIAWPVIATWDLPTLQGPTLPSIPGVDMSGVTSVVQALLSAFTDGAGKVAKGLGILLNWFAALGAKLGAILAALLVSFHINIPFSFPGVDLGQVPPAGTPWPAPFFPTSIIPPIVWPSWMHPPVVANIPCSLPPGTSMPAAVPGTFALTSMPGYYYQSFFNVQIPSGLAPGLYSQSFYVQGTSNPAGAPLSNIGKITLVAQVLEPTLSPGIRPFGMVTY